MSGVCLLLKRALYTSEKLLRFFLPDHRHCAHILTLLALKTTTKQKTNTRTVENNNWYCKTCLCSNGDFRISCWRCHYPIVEVMDYLRVALSEVSKCEECNGILVENLTSADHVKNCYKERVKSIPLLCPPTTFGGPSQTPHPDT